PAIRHAQATGSSVIVSTATIALQRQLVERDLPRLADALEKVMERRPTFAILKGRSNYVCLNRIGADEDPEEALLDEADVSWLGRHVARVHEWAQETESGDRDDLEPGVPDLAWGRSPSPRASASGHRAARTARSVSRRRRVGKH